MVTKPFNTWVRDARLAPGTNTLLGDSVPLNLDTVDALEEIRVIVECTMDSTVITTPTLDGLLCALKRVTLRANDGQDRPVVDFSGIGLLEMAVNSGLNLDRSTVEVICQHHGLFVAAGVYRIGYRIPLIPPTVQEGLRTRCLLPLVGLRQAPTLQLDFAAATDISASNPPSAINAEVQLIKRRMSPELFNSIQANGGFIKMDLIERPFNLAAGVSGEQRFDIGPNGGFLNLLFRHYKGGASITRADISASSTSGSETRWRIEQGGALFTEFKMKHLQMAGDYSRPINRPTSLKYYGDWLNAAMTKAGKTDSSAAWATAKQLVTPVTFGGAMSDGQAIQDPASVVLELAGDGLNDITELGSVLDCDAATVLNQKTELIGEVANVATNGSSLYVGGYRVTGDNWRNWQAGAK